MKKLISSSGIVSIKYEKEIKWIIYGYYGDR